MVIITSDNSSTPYGNQFHFLYINYGTGSYSYSTINLPFNAVSARTHHENNNDVVSNRRFLILDQSLQTIKVYNANSMVSQFTISGSWTVQDYCFESNREEFYTLEKPNVVGEPYIIGFYSITYNWFRKVNMTEK